MRPAVEIDAYTPEHGWSSSGWSRVAVAERTRACPRRRRNYPMDSYLLHTGKLVEALQTRSVKAILPTGMDSAMLKTLPRAVRERAVFSAGVQNVDFLTRIGPGDQARITCLQDHEQGGQAHGLTLRELCQPRSSIEKLNKDGRLNLILDTQTRMSAGYGSWIEGQYPSVLDMWPCPGSSYAATRERKGSHDTAGWPLR